MPEPKNGSAVATWTGLSLSTSALAAAVESNAARIQDLCQKNAELGHLLKEVAQMSDHPVTARGEETAAPAGRRRES